MDIQTAAIIIGWLVLALSGGLGMGKLFGRVKTVEAENERLKRLYESAPSKDDLKATAEHQESLTKAVGREVGEVKKDVREIRGDIKTILREIPKLNGGSTR